MLYGNHVRHRRCHAALVRRKSSGPAKGQLLRCPLLSSGCFVHLASACASRQDQMLTIVRSRWRAGIPGRRKLEKHGARVGR